jgi:hypothetical protein
MKSLFFDFYQKIGNQMVAKAPRQKRERGLILISEISKETDAKLILISEISRAADARRGHPLIGLISLISQTEKNQWNQ